MSENRPASPDPLRLLRGREPPFAGAALADDPDLLRVAQAWACARVDLELPDTPPPLDDFRILWEWVWSGCDFDLSDIARACGLSDNDARRGLRRLRALWLVFPDGTISEIVASALTAAANKAILEVR